MIVIVTPVGRATRALLGLDVAGLPLEEQLRAGFAALPDVDDGAAEESGIDLTAAHVQDVLVLDGEVWFSAASAAALVAALTRAAEPVVIEGNAGTAVMHVLGTYIPRPLAAAQVERGGFLALREFAVDLAGQSGARRLDAGALGTPGPRRVVALADVTKMEREILRERADLAMQRGVRLRVPEAVYIRGELICDPGVEIDLNVIMEGTVRLGRNVKIGAHSILRDATIGPDAEIRPYSIVERAVIGSAVVVGPYARIRPDTVIGDSVQIGNFVEIKNSKIGAGSRINHLAFVGDAALGRNVTLGAGTITCNHDGRGVARTDIADDVYVGSGTELVAPVSIGPGATIGAGSTITRDVQSGGLTLARARQMTIPDWQPPAEPHSG
jgi:serine acetyltransferase